jgi:hypothetical protein
MGLIIIRTDWDDGWVLLCAAQVPVLAGWGYNTPEQREVCRQAGMCVLGAAEPGRLAAVLQASEAERLLTAAAAAAADTAASHSM